MKEKKNAIQVENVQFKRVSQQWGKNDERYLHTFHIIESKLNSHSHSPDDILIDDDNFKSCLNFICQHIIVYLSKFKRVEVLDIERIQKRAWQPDNSFFVSKESNDDYQY